MAPHLHKKSARKYDIADREDATERTMQLDWIKRQSKKATPLVVHFLMIAGVGAYAVLGAMIIRKIESKTTVMDMASYKAEALQSKDYEELARVAEVGLKHRRRRRHNETELDRYMKKLDFGAMNAREKRAAAEIMRSRRCVISAIQRLSGAGCNKMDDRLVKELDKCYHVAVEQETHTKDVVFTNSNEEIETVAEEDEEILPWSFMDSLLFAFTVITTIGYGNVAPRTFGGRLFVILYGLVGIPFTLLAIADLGKFISEIMLSATNSIRKTVRRLQQQWLLRDKLKVYKNGDVNGNCKAMLNAKTEDIVSMEEGKEETGSVESEGEELDDTQTLSLFVLFIMYIALGGFMLACYEPDMTFFNAVYFNFVTLTSIGLGDIVPRSETFMLLTIIYIAIGLALTTIAIEIAADMLKRIHYYGRKIENVGSVAIWFGGKKISMKSLVKNLGDQFNLPANQIDNFVTSGLDTFVEQAIKVEEGEIETLRPPPFEPEELREEEYVDEVVEEWMRSPTPPPTPPPPPRIPTPPPSPPPPREPTPPPREPTPPPKSPTPEPTPEPSPVPTPEPVREPTPVHEPTPEPSPVPSPEPPREPTPEIREPTPSPPPPPKSPTPPPPRSPSPDLMPTPPPPSKEKPRQLTAAEIAAQKRRAYSEEAWRRYQEYQKQWKKFRQTQKADKAGTSSNSNRGSTSGPSSSKGSTGGSTQPGTPEPK